MHEKHLIEETIHVAEENIYSNYSVIQENGEFEIIMHQTKDKTESYDNGESDSESTVEVSGNGKAYFYKLPYILKTIEKNYSKAGGSKRPIVEHHQYDEINNPDASVGVLNPRIIKS